MRPALLLPIMLALLPRGAGAQTPDPAPDTFTLVGQVLDVAGDVPVDGAAVTIVELARTAYTNYVGRFSFRGLRPGTWTFRVEHLAFAGNEEPATVEGGTVLHVRLLARAIPVDGLTVSVENAEARLRDRRRKSGGESRFRVWGPRQLSRSLVFSAATFIDRQGWPFVPCPGDGARPRRCWLERGGLAPVCVMLDDAPLAGGVEALDMMAPQDLHTLEIYPDVRQVRAYSRRFMEDLSRRPRALLPVTFAGCTGRVGT